MMQLNKPSPRLAILRAQLAAKVEAEKLQRDTMRLMALAPIRCKAPAPDADSLPLPPDYWSELERWTKTLAPAKPVAEPTIKVGDTVMTKHDGLATVISLGSGGLMGEVATVRLANGYEGCASVAGLKRISQSELVSRLASTSSADGAALVNAKLTHSVCIKAHKNAAGVGNHVGLVTALSRSCLHYPDCWLPCDESGWVTHTPTADSTCPVPDELSFLAKYRNGNTSSNQRLNEYWVHGCEFDTSQTSSYDTIAWRPIA